MSSALTSVVLKARSTHTASVIFLHGLGDSGHGWEPVAQILSRSLPYVKFILPNAPSAPVTLNFGMKMPAWYDIKSLEKIASQEDEAGMRASMIKINRIIADEIAAGIPAERIILGGFSQGGAMALFTGLQSEYRFGGLAVLSGYLPIRDRIFAMATDSSKQVPIFQGHGTADGVVLFEYGKMTEDMLKSKGYKPEFHAYEYMEHASCEDELRHLLLFIKKNVPEAPAPRA
ncbi:Phospholipase/carboxylesterase [Martensiomyces pterosporus]|nr:Phospholipase/carboxylesterase [Martensiomyces pterosporus]